MKLILRKIIKLIKIDIKFGSRITKHK